MKQVDIENLLMRAEAALVVAVDLSGVGSNVAVGEIAGSTVDAHAGSCTCALCMLKHEVHRMRAKCTACGRQRFQHVGIRHVFTLKPQDGTAP